MSLKQFLRTPQARNLVCRLGNEIASRALAEIFHLPEATTRTALLAVDAWRAKE